jgi:hypothetical protein
VTTLVWGNTFPGTNVPVFPVDQTTGEPSPVSLTFEEVTGWGETTVTSSEVGQGGGPPPPPQFRLGSPPTSFNIETTAPYTGSIEVCIDYSGVSYGNENRLKLLHFDEATNSWEDVTTSLDTTNDLICGSVTSLSPFLVAEENVAPVVASLSLPSEPLSLGSSVTITAAFTDENLWDSHTATIDWGDEQTTVGAVTEPTELESGNVTGNHVYSAAGVYTVTVTVTEDMEPGYDLSGVRSSEAEPTNSYIVVYDPSAGFVTGGGWIDSPPGACLYAACTTETTGKATFGFVSRYKQGASTPDGNTVFQFKAGDLHFSSTSYDWMVPAGSKAQFKGSGQINKEGDYGFMITAIDGDLKPNGGEDQFRIKIWDKATDQIVYDNKLGEAENSDAATVLGGGSIVIHK